MTKIKPTVLIISNKRNASSALTLAERINTHGLQASVAALPSGTLAPADVLHAAQTASAVLVASTTAGAALVRSIAEARGVLIDAKLNDQSSVLLLLKARAGPAWTSDEAADDTGLDAAADPLPAPSSATITWLEAMRHGCGAALLSSVLGFIFISPAYFVADRSDRISIVGAALVLTPLLVFATTGCIYKIMGDYPPRTPFTTRLRYLLAAMGVVFLAAFILFLPPIAVWSLSAVGGLGGGFGILFSLLAILCLTGAAAFLFIVPAICLHGFALWLTARHPSLRVAPALTGAPFLALAAFAVAWLNTNTTDIRQSVEAELPRVGFRPYYDPAHPEQTSVDRAIRQFEASQNWPDRGAVNKQLLSRLQALPDKTDWIVAADGTGDALSLEEVINRAGLDARVTLRPGVYRVKNLNMSSRDTFRYTNTHEPIPDSRGSGDVDFHVSGTDAANVILELDDQSRLILGQGDTLENVTVKHIRNVEDVDMISIVGSGAVLKNNILDSRTDGSAIRISRQGDRTLVEGNKISHSRGIGLGIDAPGQSTIRTNSFNNGLHTAIVIFGKSKPTIESNQISNVKNGNGIHVYDDAEASIKENRIIQTSSSAIYASDNSTLTIHNNIIRQSNGCIYVFKNAKTTVADNDLINCTSGDYYALYAGDRALITLRRNREARTSRHANASARIIVEN